MTDEELIKAVAEKVMGWEFYPGETNRIPDYWYDQNASRDYRFVMPTSDWNPLTNANHTMMVVERMRELGFNFWIEAQVGTPWIVMFHMPLKGVVGRHEHENVGHAVCLAAIKAVGESI